MREFIWTISNHSSLMPQTNLLNVVIYVGTKLDFLDSSPTQSHSLYDRNLAGTAGLPFDGRHGPCARQRPYL